MSNSNKENKFYVADNLTAMTKMTKNNEKFDLIIVDPPYNQQHSRKIREYKDFWETHEDYSNFIEPRLKLAHKLLSNDGIITVFIGEDEELTVKTLLNNIFGEENKINTIIVETSNVAGVCSAPSKHRCTTTKCYMLVYAKNKKYINNLNILYTKSDKPFDESYKTVVTPDMQSYTLLEYIPKIPEIHKYFKDEKVSYKSINDKMCTNKKFRDLFYDKIGKFLYKLQTSKKTIQEHIPHEVDTYFIQDGRLLYKTKENTIKYTTSFNSKIHEYDGEKYNSNIRGDIWYGYYKYKNSIQNEGNVSFNGKKPLRLIQDIIYWINKPNARILDCFSGSGTTFEATQNQNNQDGGKRSCVLIQIHEETIPGSDEYKAGFKFIDEITEQRLKNIKAEYSKYVL